MSLTALGVLVLSFCTLGLGRQFVRVRFLAPMAKWILKVYGFNLKIPNMEKYFDRQVMYMFNHPSSLDIFMNAALGIPNARYLLTTKIIPILPLSFIAWLLGARFIHPQNDKHKRLHDFINATKTLKKSSDSVFASPEGSHQVIKKIAPFNKGVFHMALELKIPIVALFIYIPHDADPFIDIKTYKASDISIEVLAEIKTHDLSLQNLDGLVEKVKDLYLAKYEMAHNVAKNESKKSPNVSRDMAEIQIEIS